ncbi:MAG: helix-turn-helix domain-containing protein [Lentisphaeria bacterium]|nr:helix-turn-helix domain-containing protein [Lentisphaeria bacterium]
MNLDKLQYTKMEAAKLLSISTDKLDDLRRDGLIAARTIGSRVYFAAGELEAFVSKEGKIDE